MADIRRDASATWNGGLKTGNGRINAPSGVLKDVAYSFGTRFAGEAGTNPEELIAAAHAACFSMAFSATLERKGHAPQEVTTKASVTMVPKDGGGFRIAGILLETRGKVPGIDQDTFQTIANEAEKGCPVSNALRSLPIEVRATLA